MKLNKTFFATLLFSVTCFFATPAAYADGDNYQSSQKRKESLSDDERGSRRPNSRPSSEADRRPSHENRPSSNRPSNNRPSHNRPSNESGRPNYRPNHSHYDSHSHRPSYRPQGCNRPVIGHRCSSLPHNYIKSRCGKYYFHRGVWYKRRPFGGYIVIRPPRGVYINILPPSYSMCNRDGLSYYIDNEEYDDNDYRNERTRYRKVRIGNQFWFEVF